MMITYDDGDDDDDDDDDDYEDDDGDDDDDDEYDADGDDDDDDDDDDGMGLRKNPAIVLWSWTGDMVLFCCYGWKCSVCFFFWSFISYFKYAHTLINRNTHQSVMAIAIPYIGIQGGRRCSPF